LPIIGMCFCCPFLLNPMIDEGRLHELNWWIWKPYNSLQMIQIEKRPKSRKLLLISDVPWSPYNTLQYRLYQNTIGSLSHNSIPSGIHPLKTDLFYSGLDLRRDSNFESSSWFVVELLESLCIWSLIRNPLPLLPYVALYLFVCIPFFCMM